MSKFQIALLVLFGAFTVLAVLTFSFYKGSSSTQADITIWGSISGSDFNQFLNATKLNNDQTTIHYVEKSSTSLLKDFTEALAQGKGPDLIILPQDLLWQASNKLLSIPYGSFSERDFKDTFVEGSEIFLTPTGTYALPLFVDPMILYYNRDLLSAAGIAKPLAYWDEIYAAAGKLTKRDLAGNITQSTIALGETRNVPLAKDILSLLLLQAGTPITQLVNGELTSKLLTNPGLPVSPAESALDFYTQFANPSKPFYSWNRILPDAQTYFASGDAAYYLGFGSELPVIKRKSPTLNLGVASVPQSRVAGKSLTLGHFYGVAVSRGSANPSAALTILMQIISKDNEAAFSKVLALPPVRRDLLSEKPLDAAGPVFYDAALQAHGWLDPDSGATQGIFSEMIEAVTSGRSRVSEALSNANSRFEDAITQ